jgi:hypothetical protein
MNKIALVKFVAAVAFLLPPITQAGRKSHPLDEDAALKILLTTLQRDHVYDKRISLDCVMFDTEETTRIYFQVALREKHNKKCGGDPDTSPVIDRYRVNRASGKIERYAATEDTWKPYDPAKSRNTSATPP